ncbi:16S rRNA (guanine(527)-N(7))-methyltransferase RsmG [Piscinibacter sp.]|uniref:16S rRNA (guanine(527)-N(7))-methyltransferase RsmG n=1 Tax=Piscinibacter sp. TaxID=1903157 RepID=UPI001B720058|nr:16S rRNA (guanine(527)-N(7))-methyltransferase RsmG [Piscinibacter sp.]MBP5989938.1 16S rRNA (guanine(527)-N(7))-methyltransferase RsmG [Piscinibacter sp.]MBP6026677.1 16S rRNA (guanine(527)-N(7))-methyltransferase RsmG [Piscinibacter sp.]
MRPEAPIGTLRPALEGACDSLGLALDPAALDRLLAYLALLQRWNATYNLTAVRDPGEMLTQHLADCLAVVGPLRRQLGAGTSRRVLDVGSGGGLPGVALAVLEPGWSVTCVDAVGKKAAFIRQVAVELRLRNLAAEHARVESLKAGGFDLITSRAFASLADFVSLTRKLLAADGVWAAMKGKTPDAELAALPAGIAVFHVEPIAVPGLDAERCIVWMREAAGAAPGLVHS